MSSIQHLKEQWNSEMDTREVLENYRTSIRDLNLLRLTKFPTGTKVKVCAEKYEGQGVVVADSLCPPTQIPVHIPNGNVWYYDITDCKPIINRPDVECPCGKTPHTAKLTMPFEAWRFMYWEQCGNVTYTSIDKAIQDGKLIPCDCQVKPENKE